MTACLPLFPCLLLCCAVAGCSGAGVAPRSEVEQALARDERLSAVMAHDSVVVFFAPGGEMSNAGQAPLVGPAAIRDRLHSFVGFHVLANRLIADSTVVRGDSAWRPRRLATAPPK